MLCYKQSVLNIVDYEHGRWRIIVVKNDDVEENLFMSDVLNDDLSDTEKEQSQINDKRKERVLKNIEKALSIKFSDEQLKIITHKGKPLNVLSCAGSGKSTVLIAKMLFREFYDDVKPVNMLAITFNKDASTEIEERYRDCRKRMGAGRVSMPTFKTFHSLFYMILKNIKDYKNYSVVSEGKYNFQLMKMIRSDGSRENKEILDEMMNYRSTLINNGNSFDGIENSDPSSVGIEKNNYEKIIQRYIQCKEEDLAMDFDDMLVYLRRELVDEESESGDDARDSFRRVFKEVFIDEYQDISKVQMDVMDNLILADDRFVTIGDDDQSIYGFRGSDPTYIREFIYRYPNAERLYLGENYRCKSEILTPIISSISSNTKRVEKHIRAFNEGGKVTVMPIDKGYNYEQVASMIKEDTEDMYGDDFDDIGILVRLNSQRMIIGDILAENGVRVDIGNMNYSLRNNKVYKTIVGIVDAIKQENNKLFGEYGRVLISSMHYTVMQKYKNEKNRNWYTEVVVDNRYNIPKEVKEYIEKIKGTNNMKNAVGYVWYLVRDYYEALAKKGFGNFGTTTGIFKYMFKVSSGLTIKQFRKTEMIKESFMEMYCNSGGGVRIRTLHSVKGLEYKKVYLIGLDNNKIPNENYIERLIEKGETEELVDYIEEERRLLYVGWTRAKEHLVITYEKDNPSRFLSEVSGLELPGVTLKEG